MRELSKEFIGRGQVKGFKFTQLDANEYAYRYEVNDEGKIHYEIFYRKENSLYKCVSYPSNKAFGIWAWTSRDNAKSAEWFGKLTMLATNKETEL